MKAPQIIILCLYGFSIFSAIYKDVKSGNKSILNSIVASITVISLLLILKWGGFFK